MKILICTGIFPPDIGGPAPYAKNLYEEFLRRGDSVKVLAYKIEKKLPTGIRHFIFFLKVFFSAIRVDFIISLDTFSVGLPTVFAAKILGKKNILRTGGDFLWEMYLERTRKLLLLAEFYEKETKLSVKEKIIFFLTKFVLKNSAAIVFSTNWQKNIFEKYYNLDGAKDFIIENFYGGKIIDLGFKEKKFLWTGRSNILKNLENLRIAFNEAKKENKEISLEISDKVLHDELIRKVQDCYAVILPSIGDISPNFILEAITANKPFILTKETGFYDKLKDIGIFVNPLDIKDIKDKILFLAKDENYKEYKKRIESFNFKHSWRQIADEFLEIYRKI